MPPRETTRAAVHPMTPALPLYAYQRRWLADRARFKIARWSRQTGKTFTTTLEIVDSCYQAAAEGRRRRWVILSRGERQAREAMTAGVKPHAQAYGMALDLLDGEWRSDETRETYKTLEAPRGRRRVRRVEQPRGPVLGRGARLRWGRGRGG